MSETPLFDQLLRQHTQTHGHSPFEAAPVPVAPRPRSKPRKKAARRATSAKVST